MYQRFWLLIALGVSVALGALLPAQAAQNRLFYTDLQSCYVTGSVIPAFTLTAEVALSADYRITHRVAQQGGTPGAPVTVYEGPIASGTPRSVTIRGGNATVPGSYTITGSLFLVSSGVLVAQTSQTILIADPCPRPTPVPPPPGSPAPSAAPELFVAPADVVWSQAATPSLSVARGAILTVKVRAQNIGRGAGNSDAILTYDPAGLRLLDARPQRSGDWVRSRDDTRGTLTLVVGELRPQDQAIVAVRFLVAGALSSTTLRLVRADGLDLGNPLFLAIGQPLDGPLVLQAEQADAMLTITGRGFKPGEGLSLWGNRADGTTVALPGWFQAQDHPDGPIRIMLPAPVAGLKSIVVYGRTSGVTGTLNLRSGAAPGAVKRPDLR